MDGSALKPSIPSLSISSHCTTPSANILLSSTVLTTHSLTHSSPPCFPPLMYGMVRCLYLAYSAALIQHACVLFSFSLFRCSIFSALSLVGLLSSLVKQNAVRKFGRQTLCEAAPQRPYQQYSSRSYRKLCNGFNISTVQPAE